MAKRLLHHLSGRAGLCDGVDSKQSRVGVRQTEGCGLKRQVVTLRTKKPFVFNSFLVTYIKRVCGSFGDALAQFTGDAGASFYTWPRSQDPLQHTEGISLCASRDGALTGNQRVDQVIVSVYPQLTYMETHTAGQTAPCEQHGASSTRGICFQADVLPPRYTALSTGAPLPLRTPESPSPTCLRRECLTPGDIDHTVNCC